MRWARLLFSLRALVAVQLAAIAFLGVATIARFEIWARIDERAHYANVQSIAEHGRYPRSSDYVSPEVQAITDRTFPRPSPDRPQDRGLAGRSYEGFQAPLYYFLATPAFLVPVNHRDKVFALRVFDLALLALALGLAAVLAREMLGRDWLAGWSALLAVVLWPGVLVRMITVSNDVLAVPAGMLFALLAWQAWTRADPRRLVAAGVAMGLLVLTKLSLALFAPVFALTVAAFVVRTRPSPPWRAIALAVCVPFVLVAPWVALNHSRYGDLGGLAGGEIIDDLGGIPAVKFNVGIGLGRLLTASMPQEFSNEYAQAGLGAVTTRALVVSLVVFGLAGALAARGRIRPAALAVTGAPLVVAVLALVVAVTRIGDTFYGRYLYAEALLFALFGAVAWIAAGRVRVAIGFALSASLVALGMWAHLAGAYYFLNVGHALHLA
jgi:hypothetical protein